MDEGKGVALAILGIVAVIGVVGLVLLFTGATGNYVLPSVAKVYPGNVVTHELKNGDQFYGEGTYNIVSTDCLSNEVFMRNPNSGIQNCRDGTEKIYVPRHRAGPGEQYTDVLDGYCCTQPNARVPTGE